MQTEVYRDRTSGHLHEVGTIEVTYAIHYVFALEFPPLVNDKKGRGYTWLEPCLGAEGKNRKVISDLHVFGCSMFV